ncbi:hypothetical protein CBM2586_B10181 [Cupriavidus phytorum]|uniref:Uncharacterized protein n=1 Tax=Cupriavidus taiwanensis TaxID=164546 RepID=A0A375C923_9BURK|nr:hypothetical protein [Cupriavidus taiwanensis]SOY65586.1 hypothetical protein CBM2586_B10181 [Cupriavidus taiwanensis]
MTQYLVVPAKQAFTDSTGSPLVGGKLYTYDAGTSTPKTTYQDRGGSTANTNPIVLDARGECTVYGTGNYRLVLKDANDVLIWDRDNVAVNTEYPTTGRYLGTQTFLASGTYVPAPGMSVAKWRAQGGGGGGAGCGGAGAGNVSAGAPGTNGAYAEGTVTAAQVGASKPVTIGAGGAGASNAAGSDGGATSMGTLFSVPGGKGGGAPVNNTAAPTVVGNGNVTAAATGAALSSQGLAENFSQAISANIGIGGAGGHSVFGPGGRSVGINSNGNPGFGYGAGGSGTVVNQAGGTATGGNGAAGIMILDEFS